MDINPLLATEKYVIAVDARIRIETVSYTHLDVYKRQQQMYGIVVGADTGKPFGQFAKQAPAEQSGYVGDVIAACKV